MYTLAMRVCGPASSAPDPALLFSPPLMSQGE